MRLRQRQERHTLIVLINNSLLSLFDQCNQKLIDSLTILYIIDL